jgi:uncharacterized protein YkwD
MLKSILSLCIMAAFGVLVFTLLLPAQANQIAQQVLSGAVTLDMITGVNAPVQAISHTVTHTVSNVSSALIKKNDKGTVQANNTNTSVLSIENIIDATNNERVKAGLLPLKTNDKLEASAKIKVDDMITHQYFEHTSPAGKTVADLGNQVGYDYVVMGENLALGNFTSANDLLQAWMNSPGHRANILNSHYQDIGVYAAQGSYQGRTVWFAVQHFGTQRGVCPSISASLKGMIASLNMTIKNEQDQITVLRAKIEDPNHPQGTEYSALIAQFNTLVATYNSDVTSSQQKITEYNQGVIAFNKCLSLYQVSKTAE